MSPADLIAAARDARARAYAPYSRYLVGAALRTADGRVFTGANVENASYGLTVCAERVAVQAAVAAGVRDLLELAVATEDGAAPCGACRQVLGEFARDLPIHLAAKDGPPVTVRLAELLPRAFGPRAAR